MPIPELPFTVEEWSTIQSRLLWCYEGVVRPNCRNLYAPRRHLSAWCLQTGSVTLRQGKQSWHAQTGEWLFAGTDPIHQEFSDDARIVSVNFKLEWPSGDPLVNSTLVLPDHDLPELGRAGKKLARFVGARFPEVRWDLWVHRMELASFLELQKLFAGWILAFVNAMLAAGVVPTRMAGVDSRVLAVLRKLDAHAWGTPFNDRELAREAGVSAGHLDRLFLQGVGVTPRTYLKKRRLESAMALLTDSTRPLKQIAFDLGFSSSSHFCHWFQTATGKSLKAHRAAKEA